MPGEIDDTGGVEESKSADPDLLSYETSLDNLKDPVLLFLGHCPIHFFNFLCGGDLIATVVDNTTQGRLSFATLNNIRQVLALAYCSLLARDPEIKAIHAELVHLKIETNEEQKAQKTREIVLRQSVVINRYQRHFILFTLQRIEEYMRYKFQIDHNENIAHFGRPLLSTPCLLQDVYRAKDVSFVCRWFQDIDHFYKVLICIGQLALADLQDNERILGLPLTAKLHEVNRRFNEEETSDYFNRDSLILLRLGLSIKKYKILCWHESGGPEESGYYTWLSTTLLLLSPIWITVLSKNYITVEQIVKIRKIESLDPNYVGTSDFIFLQMVEEQYNQTTLLQMENGSGVILWLINILNADLDYSRWLQVSILRELWRKSPTARLAPPSQANFIKHPIQWLIEITAALARDVPEAQQALFTFITTSPKANIFNVDGGSGEKTIILSYAAHVPSVLEAIVHRNLQLQIQVSKLLDLSRLSYVERPFMLSSLLHGNTEVQNNIATTHLPIIHTLVEGFRFSACGIDGYEKIALALYHFARHNTQNKKILIDLGIVAELISTLNNKDYSLSIRLTQYYRTIEKNVIAPVILLWSLLTSHHQEAREVLIQSIIYSTQLIEHLIKLLLADQIELKPLIENEDVTIEELQVSAANILSLLAYHPDHAEMIRELDGFKIIKQWEGRSLEKDAIAFKLQKRGFFINPPDSTATVSTIAPSLS